MTVPLYNWNKICLMSYTPNMYCIHGWLNPGFELFGVGHSRLATLFEDLFTAGRAGTARKGGRASTGGLKESRSGRYGGVGGDCTYGTNSL
jgi:hypothetical protein